MAGRDESELKQCTVVLTRNCNLRCDFCYVKEAGYQVENQLSYNEVKKIVDFCGEANVKYMFFTGGEPLTYPYMIDVLKYIRNNYPTIVPTIATNGVLLEDRKFCKQLIDSGLHYIDISMKGSNQTEWTETTGYDGLERQLHAIQNLASMPVEFTCSMVVTPENVMSICEAVRIAKTNGAKQFSFTFIIDNSKSEYSGIDYLKNNNPFELIELFVSQIDRLTSITNDWWIEYSFPLCVYTEAQLKLLDGRLAGPCQVHLENAITVNTKLELLPCDMYINNSLGKMGKDFSSYDEFCNMIDNFPFQSVMQSIRQYPSSKCSICRYLKKCYGGCPVLWQHYSFENLMEMKKVYAK